MKRRVGEMWETFARGVLPPDCGETQRRDMRRAFYAGAFVSMDGFMASMSNEDEMTAADEQVVIDFNLERAEFLANLKLGRE